MCHDPATKIKLQDLNIFNYYFVVGSIQISNQLIEDYYSTIPSAS